MLALTLRPACWPGSVRIYLILPTLSDVFELGPRARTTVSMLLQVLMPSILADMPPTGLYRTVSPIANRTMLLREGVGFAAVVLY
jgi:hypothetical protein